MADTNTFYVFEAPPTVVERAAIGRIEAARIRAPRENLTFVLSSDASAELASTLARELAARSWVVDIRKTDSELCRVHAFDPTGARRWARTCIPNEVAKELATMGLGDPNNPNLTDAQRDTQRAFLESAFHGPVAVLEQEVGLKVFDWPKFELSESVVGASAESVAPVAEAASELADEDPGEVGMDSAGADADDDSNEEEELNADAQSGDDEERGDAEEDELSAGPGGDHGSLSEEDATDGHEDEAEKPAPKKKPAASKKKASAKKKSPAPRKAPAAKKTAAVKKTSPAKKAPAKSSKKKK